MKKKLRLSRVWTTVLSWRGRILEDQMLYYKLRSKRKESTVLLEIYHKEKMFGTH